MSAVNGNIDTATISWGDGDQIPPTNSGYYYYGGGTVGIGQGFLVQSDTAGLITGYTASGKTTKQLTQYVLQGGVTRFKLVALDLATTRTALPTANLVAGKV